MRLTILHTNDIHSNFENFSKIVTKINELMDGNTLLLDAGDFADFKRIELQGTDGMAATELLEYAGYDALTIGNNETFNGIEVLENMASNRKLPYLSCNISTMTNKSIEGVKKSVIINKFGLRILIIGASPDIGPFYEINGMVAKDFIETIKGEIDSNEGNYDICILLSHLGMTKDRIVAAEFKEIDIIIGGHLHILMDEPEVINGTIIFTSGAQGENLGVLNVEVIDNKVQLIEGRNINVTMCEPSEDIIDLVKQNKEKAIDKLSSPLFTIDRDIFHDIVEENPMTNLLADGLRDLLQCDFAIINSGVINGGIRRGNVSLKKILELCPSPLNPTTFKIQGKHIYEALQNSLDTDYCYDDGKGPGFRGKYVGRLHISNGTIEYDGRNISKVSINGESLDSEKWYKVATSDYLQRGSGYPSFISNKDVEYNSGYLRDVIEEYLEKEEYVEKAFVDRWILK